MTYVVRVLLLWKRNENDSRRLGRLDPPGQEELNGANFMDGLLVIGSRLFEALYATRMPSTPVPEKLAVAQFSPGAIDTLRGNPRKGAGRRLENVTVCRGAATDVDGAARARFGAVLGGGVAHCPAHAAGSYMSRTRRRTAFRSR